MKVDKTFGCTAPSSCHRPYLQLHAIRYTYCASNCVRRLSVQWAVEHTAQLLMLSQWRISATNGRKGAWSRAFICGAQIKWYKRI